MSGKTEAAASAVARARASNLSDFYTQEITPIRPGDFAFTLDLLRPGAQNFPLDTALVSFQWTDEQDGMSGSLELQRPDPTTWASLPIAQGQMVRCRVQWGGKLYTVWTMGVEDFDADPIAAHLSVPLKDDMVIVKRSSRRWTYRKNKAHPHGWYGHQILADAAKVAGIKLGRITRCSTPMPNVDVTGSFLTLANKIYAREENKEGHSFILRMRNGLFEAVPYVRNTTIYVVSADARDLTVNRKFKRSKPHSVITGKGRTGKGSHVKHLRTTVSSKTGVEQLGYVHETINYGRVDSLDDLKANVTRDLAKNLRRITSVTCQFEGVPFIKFGDGVRIIVPQDRLTGKNSYVYATTMRYQVQGGSFTSDGDFTSIDPFLYDLDEWDAKARAKAKAKAAKKT